MASLFSCLFRILEPAFVSWPVGPPPPSGPAVGAGGGGVFLESHHSELDSASCFTFKNACDHTGLPRWC